MRDVAAGLLCVLMCNGACGNSESKNKNNTSAESTEATSAKGLAKAESLAKAKAWAKVAGDSAVKPAPKFAASQPGITGLQVRFIGWTEDESQFVVQVNHAASWEYMDAGSASYELYRVHDTLTGKLIRSFRKSIDGSPDKNDQNTRAWEQAGTLSEWRDWKQKNSLLGMKPSLDSGDWRVRTAVEDDTLARIDSLKLRGAKTRVEVQWRIRKGASQSTKPPKIEVSLEHRGERMTPLVYTLPFRLRDFYTEFEGEVVAKGTIKAYFSPREKRVVFTTNFQLQVDSEAFPPPSAAYFIRSLGPQLKIVDASGSDRARTLAMRLAQAELPVTIVESAEVPSEQSMLYFRDIPATAFEKIEDAVPGIGLEKLKKKGWLNAIIILGDE